MCGIVGFNWEDKGKIEDLAALLEHRGPEQHGYHVADGVSIGHKRLCILDLSEKGRQPIYNEDRSICISYNGEIYNFKELRATLIKAGHQFQSNTDTEVLVHGYEQWGEGLLQQINGQFSFCIFDAVNRRLFLARDRLGIKPLYYYSQGEKFIFGSELKVILNCRIDKAINTDSLSYYMMFGHTPSGSSIFRDIHKLLPGCFMVYDLVHQKIDRIESYWRPVFNPCSIRTEQECFEQLRDKIETSVRRRLVADVPLGAFLSGGIDSSIIVSIMRKYVDDLKTFSIKFDYADFNESYYSEKVSKLFQTHHFEITFGARDIKNMISDLIYHYDDPFSDPSMIPTALVCQVAKPHVTVCLSGTGGDELFGGYDRYHEFSILKRLNGLPNLIKQVISGGINLTNMLLKKDKLNKLQSFLGKRGPDHLIYLKLLSYMFRGKEESGGNLDNLERFSKYFEYSDPLNNIFNYDLHEYLPEDLLVKEDRASMAVSLEARVPFLDHELVEWSLKLPSDWKIRYGQKKWILKKAYEGILPHEILCRKKQGFGVPLVHYFRNELKKDAYDWIFNHCAHEYFDKVQLKKFWDSHQQGVSDYSRILWSAIMFNGWYDRWMTG